MATEASPRLRAGLCVFGLTHACGFTWTGTPKANPRPLSIRDLLRRAAEDGLAHVETPARLLGDTSAAALTALREEAESLGVGLLVAGGNLPAGGLAEDMRLAAALGSPVVRCTLSTVLCGDRRGFPGGWPAHLQRCATQLEGLLPLAEKCGVALAIENHQDADSEDLLRLCRRFESAHLGITLDCGNPLAVMEDPLAFARRLAPYLRHAHLKDYTVHHAPNGFRLVRAPLGSGVIDFPALLRLMDSQPHKVTRSLEMAALQARLIPYLEPSWWAEYPQRDAPATAAALANVWPHLRPGTEEWRTPFERDESGEALLAYEWDHHRRSVAYLRRTDPA